MEFVYKNKGVCSRETIIDINDDHIINDIKIVGGCDGNLKGIMALLKGQKAEEVIPRLQGLTCGFKATSCPDQIAKALEEAVTKLSK